MRPWSRSCGTMWAGRPPSSSWRSASSPVAVSPSKPPRRSSTKAGPSSSSPARWRRADQGGSSPQPARCSSASPRRGNDLVDQAPGQGLVRVQRVSGQGQVGGAPAPDPPRQAGRSSRAGNQAATNLRERDLGVLGRGNPGREGRQFYAGAQAMAVQARGRPAGQPVQQQRRTPGEPDQVSPGRIWPGAEFIKVTPGAEVGTTAPQHDSPVWLVQRHLQGADQVVPHTPVDRVPPGGPGERNGYLAG